MVEHMTDKKTDKKTDIKIKVICTWPADDVTISLNGHPMILLEEPHSFNKFSQGMITRGMLGLTVTQAEVLKAKLESAIQIAKELEEGWIKQGSTLQ